MPCDGFAQGFGEGDGQGHSKIAHGFVDAGDQARGFVAGLAHFGQYFWRRVKVLDDLARQCQEVDAFRAADVVGVSEVSFRQGGQCPVGEIARIHEAADGGAVAHDFDWASGQAVAYEIGDGPRELQGLVGADEGKGPDDDHREFVLADEGGGQGFSEALGFGVDRIGVVAGESGAEVLFFQSFGGQRLGAVHEAGADEDDFFEFFNQVRGAKESEGAEGVDFANGGGR